MNLNNKKPKLEEFRTACIAKAGNKTEIAKYFGVHRHTIENWVKDEKYKLIYSDAHQSILDLTETQLLNLIKGVPKYKIDEETGEKVFDGWHTEPNPTAIIFKLKTQGKDRGYIEKTIFDTNIKFGKDAEDEEVIE